MAYKLPLEDTYTVPSDARAGEEYTAALVLYFHFNAPANVKA